MAITLIVPTDTSECERVFSLMNDLKTAERNLLGKNLKNPMKWHFMHHGKGKNARSISEIARSYFRNRTVVFPKSHSRISKSHGRISESIARSYFEIAHMIAQSYF